MTSGEALSDRARWEQRYGTRVLERRAPPAWLVDHLEVLPHRGRALDVATGLGAAALALARRGLSVVAFDIATRAVQQLARWACEEALPLHPFVANARSQAWPAKSFDVITQFYFLERSCWPRLRDALRPGGWVLVETASTRNAEIGGVGPRREAWCLRPGELEQVFAGYRIHALRETVLEGPLAVQSIVARKPG